MEVRWGPPLSHQLGSVDLPPQCGPAYFYGFSNQSLCLTGFTGKQTQRWLCTQAICQGFTGDGVRAATRSQGRHWAGMWPQQRPQRSSEAGTALLSCPSSRQGDRVFRLPCQPDIGCGCPQRRGHGCRLSEAWRRWTWSSTGSWVACHSVHCGPLLCTFTTWSQPPPATWTAVVGSPLVSQPPLLTLHQH